MNRVVIALAVLAVLTLVPLLVWDGTPKLFPEHAHYALAAMPLALIAVVCLAHRLARRVSVPEIAKTCMLAAAFLFWAANQFWPEHPMATRFNDLAIALFVLDVIFTMVTADATRAQRCDSIRRSQ
jgi:hypothetical protein